MAAYKTTDKRNPDDPMAIMRKRYKTADSLWADKFQDCSDDVRFTFEPGAQWDADMKVRRGQRPNYEFNKTRPAVKQVTNDMRQNSPAIKIRASEDSHRDLAEIMQGLIRNIEAQSQADTAYDTAGFFSATGGFGIFRFATEYSNEDMFEQDIRVKEMRNPFCVKFGPAKAFDKRDARYLFVEDSLDADEFKLLYPDALMADFEGGSVGRYGDWFTEKRVRVAEYWCKHPDTKTIYQLSDGRVIDQDDYDAIKDSLDQEGQGPDGQPVAPLTLKNQRKVKFDRIEMSIVSGAEVLDGPHEWAGKFFPFVPVWGESVNIEGDEIFQGIARPIKDAQRLFNWNVCTGMEVMANQPKAPLLATVDMIEGNETQWKNMAVENAPALFYKPGPNGEKPERVQPPQFPAALFNGAQFASDLIKSVSNVVDAPIQTRASSGKAIQAVEHQQDVGNFDFIDNLARAKAFGGEILVDLIPKIYDTERTIMVLGEDGAESYHKLNQSVQQPDGSWQVINDLSQGKYAVTVTVGPSYATRRMETVAALTQIAGNPNPQVSLMATYGIIKNMDEPGLDDVEKGLRKILVAQQLLEPGENDAPPTQQQPDPKAMADAALKKAQADNYDAKTAQTKVDTAITVQHAPLQAMQEAAKAEMHVADAYAKAPDTPYWGPPNQGQPQQ